MNEDTFIDLTPQQTVILNGVAVILMELIDFTSSSESEEDELEYLMDVMGRREKLPKLKNYVENIVPTYSDQQFKSHFR